MPISDRPTQLSATVSLRTFSDHVQHPGGPDGAELLSASSCPYSSCLCLFYLCPAAGSPCDKVAPERLPHAAHWSMLGERLFLAPVLPMDRRACVMCATPSKRRQNNTMRSDMSCRSSRSHGHIHLRQLASLSGCGTIPAWRQGPPHLKHAHSTTQCYPSQLCRNRTLNSPAASP